MAYFSAQHAKVDRRLHMPGEGHIAPAGPPCVKLHVVIGRDYLRTALTYMLISMPHGTSTIFGAFQAIFGAPCKTGRHSALSIKVTPEEKFASEIFSPYNFGVFLLQRETRGAAVRGRHAKPKPDQGVHGDRTIVGE
jgi:hypothetical protein